jgi:hypothetical protein
MDLPLEALAGRQQFNLTPAAKLFIGGCAGEYSWRSSVSHFKTNHAS